MSRPLKRSFTLDGHRTSLSLEPPFWDALQDVAREEGVSLAALVQRIDRERGRTGVAGEPDSAAERDTGLSGAIRIHLLQHYRARAR